MGGACSTNGGEEKCISDIGRKARRDHWEDKDVGGWTILKWILDSLDMAQDRDQWRTLVNTVMNFPVS
jgi:hypothetical protein